MALAAKIGVDTLENELEDENFGKKVDIITIEIDFSDSMNVLLTNAFIMPTPWLPDIYVNPSNNGNLQSSKYKDINLGIRRTNQEFLNELRIAKEVADQKKKRKIS